MRTIIKVLIASISLIIIISPAFGLTVDEAVSAAKRDNPDILAARNHWEAVKSSVLKVSAWPDPQLEFMYEQVPGDLNIAEAQMRMYGFSQMIPFPGKPSIKRFATEKTAGAAYESYRAVERSTVAKVKSAYYSLFLIDRSIQINEENNGLIQKFAKIAEAKYIVGDATQHDVLKAQIELSLLINESITLEQQRWTAESRLNALLNLPLDSPVDISGEVKVNKPILDLKDLEETAVKNNPTLKMMEFYLKRSDDALLLSKMEFLPDFKIKLLQRDMAGVGPDGWNASLMMDIPLWFWKQSFGVAEASAFRDKAESAYTNEQNMVRFNVVDAYFKVDSSRRLARLFETSIIPQAEQALDSATRAYESDKVDFLTLINSQKTLEDARLGYFKALSDFGKNFSELERLVGKDLSIGGNLNE
jgi:outer membrane protein TolC